MTPHLEPNERGPFSGVLREGDAVNVYFASKLDAGLCGMVTRKSGKGIQLRVHSAEGYLEVVGHDGKTCLDWDVFIPWTSIGFVRHTKNRPVGCLCDEGVEQP